MLLSYVRRNLTLMLVLCALLVGQTPPAMAAAVEKTPVEAAPASANAAVNAAAILLSIEYDKCSGQLYVMNTNLQWQRITRGSWTTVYVRVNPNGYWLWRCGSSYEKSRSSILPFQVRQLRVYHSTNNRDITWRAYSG